MNGPAAQPPPYARIVNELRRRIEAGELRAGDRVPSTRQVAREWGVAMATAAKALTTLGQTGLVRTVPRVGTVVAAPESQPGPQPRAPRRREARDAEPELTRERIVGAAVRIADTEGLGALSMRRVAAELGGATMSLYRHVSGKDDLLLLMADAVFAENRLPETPPSGWRAQLELVARLHWKVYRRHPWMARISSLTRPMLAPSGMAYTEWAMRALAEVGLDLATTLHFAVMMAGYSQGIAVNLESELEAEQNTGITSDEWMESQYSTLDAIMASGRFPMLARIMEQDDFDLELDRVFELGLNLMLDGLAVLVERARAGA